MKYSAVVITIYPGPAFLNGNFCRFSQFPYKVGIIPLNRIQPLPS